MTSTDNQQKSSNQLPTKRNSFWRRKPRGVVVQEYQVGHIRTEEVVYIESNGIVVGDIFAPKVVVTGIVYGSIVSLELLLEAEGQLWGDAYTVSTQAKPQSIIRGWLNSIDREQYDLYYLRKQPQLIIPEQSNGHLPQALHKAVDELSAAMPPGRASILEQLRDEAALAVSSRIELERAFNGRVNELSGANISEAARLRERISLINSEHISMQQRLAELNQNLQDRDSSIQNFETNLEKTKASLENVSTDNETLKDKNYWQTREIEDLQSNLAQLQTELAQTKDRIEQAEGRNTSLETTLQSSLQRTAEQEDALLRWQELAEINEGRARKAEEQVESSKLDIQEFSQSLEMVKGQRDQIEKEWEAAYQEVQELRTQLKKQSNTASQEEEAATRVIELTKRLENKNQELAITRQAMVETTGANNQSKQQINHLEKELNKAQQIAHDKTDQHAKLQEEAVLLHAQIQQLETELSSQQSQSEEDNAILNAHKTAVARIAELETLTYRLEQSEQKGLVDLIDMETKLEAMQQTVAEAEEEQESYQNEINRLKGQIAEAQVIRQELAGLRQDLRFSERRVSDAEDDIETYQQQLQSQGGRLAEIQSELVEKELKLNAVIDRAKQQAVEIKKIKQLAGKRIQRLEKELGQKKTQIEDLMKVLERMERRQ